MSNNAEMSASAETQWKLAFLLAAIAAIGPLSIDMYLPSLPTLVRALHASAQNGQTSVSIFFVGVSLGQFVYGPASDRFGRRSLLLLGACVFTAASIVCAASSSISILIGARLAQSLGACACMVISRAVVRDHFSHQESARFFSMLALISGAAPVLAPLLGSLLMSFAGWRGIFVTLAIFGTVVGLGVLLGLPESRSQATLERARGEHPLQSYLTLLSERRLVGYLLATAFNSSAMFTYIANSPSVLIGHFGVSPLQFGLLFALNGVGLVGSSQINRHLLKRYSADGVLRAVSTAGVVICVFCALIALTGLGGLWGVSLALFAVTSCVGSFQGPGMAGALSVDPLRAGSTSALIGGASFGVGAIAGSIAGAFGAGKPTVFLLVIGACFMLSAAATWFIALPHSRGSAT